MATPVEIAVKAVGTAAAGRAIGGLDSKSSRLGSTLRNVARAGALALAAGAVYGAKKLVDFTQAAIEDEAAQSRLATTLRNTTGATDKQVASVERWISKQGRLLGVTDDELRPALQRMAEGTHSVAKAQDMVSLAMDVAAGTGKSLKSVTEALLRAQNGSVGGLSRYGIATKDAKGETLSFHEVVRGMAETFGGQASRQAGTLEGKMARLKVLMSETGEAIGSKLIPVISDLSEWFLEKGLPGVEHFWDKLAPARDAIRKVVSGVGEVIGAIRGGDWGKAWDVAREAARTALSTQASMVKRFAGDRLVPAIREALGRAQDAWAKKWEGFWKDPEKAYDKTISSTKSFGAQLKNEAQSAAQGAAFAFIRAFNKLPGQTARVGVQTLNAWRQSTSAMPGLARHIAVDVAAAFAQGLSGGPRAAASFGVLIIANLRRGLSGARGVAVGIGVDIVQGLVSGVRSAAGALASAAADAVLGALNAARHALDSHSPSRKFRKLGHDAIRGLILGFDDGSEGVAKVVDRLGALIESTYNRRARAARRRIDNAKRERQALHALDEAEKRRAKSLHNLDDALVRNGRNQDRMNAKLDAARGKLKAVRAASDDYARSIRDAVIASGDVTTLGKDEAGTATTTGILDQLRDRVANAKRFADLIAKLTKQGLNKTTLKQLLAAGVDSLSTAEAIAAGGGSAIDEINKLTNQLTQSGTGLGKSAANTMYKAGIRAADGLVEGLEKRSHKLDRIGERLARQLADAVRHALKIKSPSGVFRDIGKLTVQGLTIGLDDTHVRTSGRKLASSLVDGFASPELTARAVFAETVGGDGSAPTVRVQLTAAQATELQRGRGITLDVDMYGAAGGRRIAKVVKS